MLSLYQAVMSSFAFERDALVHKHEDIAADLKLLSHYQLPLSTFLSAPFFCKGSSDLVVHFYNFCLSDDKSVYIWMEGSFSANDLNGGAPAIIWDHGYWSAPRYVTSAESRVLYCTQVVMIIISNAL